MNDLISGCLMWVLGVFIVLLMGLIGLSFVVDLYSAVNNKYQIYDGGDKAFYTSSYKEENGCVYFKDHLDMYVVQCGSYRIVDRRR